MRQICMDCGILYGVKEPYDDDHETHGLCGECFAIHLRNAEPLGCDEGE